jgi:membrane protein DedA with SNARE-associated domain
MVDAMMRSAGWVLFVWVFANQGGVPVPVLPSLVAAGALAGTGGSSFVTTLAAAVAAAVCADMVWYALGRWRGAWALHLLCRLSHQPRTCANHAQHLFRAHEVGFQFWARFLPELNPIAAGLAGATGVALGRYVVIAGASAVAWAGACITTGYLLSDVLEEVTAYLGGPVVVLLSLTLVAFVAIRYVCRHRPRASTVPPRPAGKPGNPTPEEGRMSTERRMRTGAGS